MDERMRFVAAHQTAVFTISELCDTFGISRKTGYKWLSRYDQDGPVGLADRSSAPRSHPNQTPEAVAEALRACREAHPHWGPRKLLAYLDRRGTCAANGLPAASTAGDILRRAGLVSPSRRRTRSAHPTAPPIGDVAPNQIYTADFKGQFRTGDGQVCYPLTVMDAATRYLLCCAALPSTSSAVVLRALTRLFEDVGVPCAIRTDNGPPFCTGAIAGLSQLNVWWMQLGIQHQRIAPASPQQNGSHERMHKTLKAETTRPPAASLAAQQVRFDQFRHEYNLTRPHEALDMATPASLWTPSCRAMPTSPQLPCYPGHLPVRTVKNSGCITFMSHLVFVSEVLIRHKVALEEVDDGLWSVYFYDRLLGRLDERTKRLTPLRPLPKRTRRIGHNL